MLPVIAIYDIGKTNKKLLLFDEDYNVVEQSEVSFEEIEDDDGFPCDDIHAIVNWIQNSWVEFEEGDKYEIKAVNFTTYGASLLHIDQDDKLVTPLYNYLKAFPEDILDQFYDQYGEKSKIALETASPFLGMLNSGLLLYWLKLSKTELFDRIKYSFHFPNYLSYLFAKNAHTDYTSLGCHTTLWNFRDDDCFPFLLVFDLCLCADLDPSSTCLICVLYSSSAFYDRSCREVWPFNMLAQFVDGDFRII